MAKNSVEIPYTFVYRGMVFYREPELEIHTLIYSNDRYYIKWDADPDGFREFANFYKFLTQECCVSDLPYFATTKRIKVNDISGYGYMQPRLKLESPKGFDPEKYIRRFETIKRKYDLSDFAFRQSVYHHNIGFLDNQPKIFDAIVE